MPASLKDLKAPFFTIFFIFLFLFLYTKLAGPVPFFINSVQTTKQDLFQVDGAGEASAAPDEATISFAVTKQASTVADAQNQTNSAISSILDALKSSGVNDKDIKTTSYNVNPNYNNFGANQTISGYSVMQNVDVKIHDLKNVNTTLDSLTAHGANVIGQVNFGFSDSLKEKLSNQARQEAVEKAKSKAQSLAGAAGIHLGSIINVTESQDNAPRPVPMLQVADKTEGNAPTQVTPGENSISSTITLTYQTY